MAERSLTYFISDIHLGASYIGNHREHERRVVEWLREIGPTARRLYLLGDVLDYWFEYKEVVPRGYVRFFGALAALADSGVEITWFKGNHDIWISDYIPSELGVTVVDGALDVEIDGKRFFMEHGDGVGRMKRSFRMLRRLFRNRVAQKLFSGIHPRWTVPFAHRWSSHSRETGGGVRVAEYGGLENDPLAEFARGYLVSHGHVDYFIFGHRHQLVDEPLGDDSRLVILGDWITRFSYAVFDSENLEIKSLKP